MTIKLDVLLVQIIHIAILFWIFRKVIGDSLTTALLERKIQKAKLDNADAEYAKILAEAKLQSESTMKEGLIRKEEIIAEATLVAQKKADDLMIQAEKNAQRIQNDAEVKAFTLEQELKDGFVDGVKATTKLVINKLVKEDVSVQNAYIDSLVNEFVWWK
jgi:F0F1-type ATP synthase membrane subunit b/b'